VMLLSEIKAINYILVWPPALAGWNRGLTALHGPP
jgi:hypothetical protein